MSEDQGETTFVTRLIGRAEVAEGTMAFRFEKPSGWKFKAGQFLEAGLIHPPETDEEGDFRAFSIASAPQEADIMVATRMRDTAFKRVLGRLAIGTQVQMEGPFGDLVLHNNASRAAVFLTGGIGITPVRSIVFRAARERLPHRIFLFYSNSQPAGAPFLKELEALTGENPNFKFIPTMTRLDAAHGAWHGETGQISKQMLDKHLGAVKPAVYYITGPARLVTAMRDLLNRSGIDDDDIRTEEFSGY